MSLPEKHLSNRVLRTPSVSINFEKLEDSQLVSYFSKPGFKEDAFREVLRRYQEPIYRYVRNLLISAHDTEELVTRTFVSLFKKIPGIKWNASLKFFIYRLASNESISFLKQKNPTMDFDNAQKEITEYLEIDSDINPSLIEVKLQKALCYLPFKQKLVFVLAYFEGFDFEQIGELTQASAQSLKSTYEHAHKKLDVYLGVM